MIWEGIYRSSWAGSISESRVIQRYSFALHLYLGTLGYWDKS